MKSLKIAGGFGIAIVAFMIFSIIITSVISFTINNPFLEAINSNESFETALNNSLNLPYEENIEEYKEKYELIKKIETIFLLFISLFSLFFFWGFVILGRKFDNKLLRVIAQILIVIAGITFILSIKTLIQGNFYIPDFYSNPEDISFGDIFKEKIMEVPVIGTLFTIFGNAFFWPIFIISLLASIALKICFGISIIRLNQHKIKFAEIAGSFEIASLIFTFLGHFAIIFESVIFFMVDNGNYGNKKRKK